MTSGRCLGENLNKRKMTLKKKMFENSNVNLPFLNSLSLNTSLDLVTRSHSYSNRDKAELVF